MSDPIISLKNISVLFNNKDKQIKAVDDVSLNINKGDIFGIIGYSGAGKSTLVRVINLLQKPTKGTVNVDGANLLKLNNSDLRKSRKKIGMIFQHFNLMNQRTVYNNVLFALKESKLNSQEKKARVTELLDLVELSDKGNYYPRQLSGGQKQRVGIARALANHPNILISDEATSALDPKTTKSILSLLEDVNKKLGITIVLITHQMEAIKQICHNVSVMEKGKIIEKGSVFDIFIHPKQNLTKSFINSTTRMDETLDYLLKQDSIKNMSDDEVLLQLSYFGQTTDEPLISSLYKNFQVTANILFGNIESLQGEPIGNLIVTLNGSQNNLLKAISDLKDRGVNVTKLDPKKGVLKNDVIN